MSFEFKVLKILLQFGATHIKFRISSAKRRMRKKSTHKHIFIFQHCPKSQFVSWLGDAKLLLSITYTHKLTYFMVSVTVRPRKAQKSPEMLREAVFC